MLDCPHCTNTMHPMQPFCVHCKIYNELYENNYDEYRIFNDKIFFILKSLENYAATISHVIRYTHFSDGLVRRYLGLCTEEGYIKIVPSINIANGKSYALTKLGISLLK